MILRALLTLLLITLPGIAKADLLEWQSNNIQLLHGSGFDLADNTQQTTFTFEHVNGWKYGDNFFYIDNVFGHDNEINAEWSPRLSLSKMTGYDFSHGIVQDVLLSGTWEKGRNFDVYLLGGAIDLDLPGFNFFQMNFYNRNNPHIEGHGWQTTFVWSRPFEIGKSKWSFDGYFDYADYEEGVKNFFTQPQLLLDVGHSLGYGEGKAYVGLEWRYWDNKYGVDGISENAPQAMMKWVF